MDKSIFQRYADIKNEIVALQAEAEEIQAEVAAQMTEENIDKVESDFGTFYFTTRKTYDYSPAITQLADQLKEMKKDEEAAGIPFSETRSLTFRAPKVTQ